MENKKETAKSVYAKPNAELCVIDAEMAKKLLENNIGNRAVSRPNVNFLKNQLEQGKWLMNGETIKIASDGTVIDGQHRLIACAETGVPMPSLIVYNAPKESMHTIDTGRNRSPIDVVSIKLGSGQKYLGYITSAAKFAISFNAGRYGIAAGSGAGEAKAYNPDNSDILKFIDAKFIDFICSKATVYNSGDRLVEPKLFFGIYWVLYQRALSKEVVDDFMAKFSAGISITVDSPIYAIRQKLIATKTRNITASSQKGSPLTGAQKLWSIIKAWNYYRAGRKVSKFGEYSSDPLIIAQ